MIPFLVPSDYGLLASGVYSILTFVAWVHPDIPPRASGRFFAMTVILLLVSKVPFVTFFFGPSGAERLGFVIAIVAGIVSCGADWYRGRFYDCRDHSPKPLDDDEQQ